MVLKFVSDREMTDYEIIEDRHPFYWEKQRLESFDNEPKWPFGTDHTCNPKCMAEAGWFFIGSEAEPDLVKCFACDKELDGWEEDDDPWKEHKKHCLTCPFVAIGKNEADISIYEHLDLSCALDIKVARKNMEVVMDKFNVLKTEFLKEHFPGYEIPELGQKSKK